MSDTETPEQWAARLIDAYILAATRAESEMCDPSGKCGVKMRAIIDELAAVKRKADAADLWRAEALAADAVYSAYLNDQPVLESEVAWDEKIRARIAAGLK